MRTVLIAAALLAATAATAARAEEPRYFSLTIDNDSLLFRGLDRHYSSGLQLGVQLPMSDLPEGLRKLPPFAWSADSHVTFALGHRMYSPDDLTIAPPDPTDHPYAGWLYVMTDIRTKSGPVVDYLTITAGVVGPSAQGERAQRFLHSLTDYPDAQGWPWQIEDRFAFTLGYERNWRDALAGTWGGHRYDLTPRVSGVLGTVYTYAAAGAVFRYGSLLPDDLPATNLSLMPSRDGFRGAPQFGWYAWAGVEARAVAHSIFIEGPKPQGDTIEPKPYSFDVAVGGAVFWPKSRVGLSIVRKSDDYKGQKETDLYGQLTFTFGF